MKKTKIMSLLPIGAHTHSRYAAFLPAQFFMVEQHWMETMKKQHVISAVFCA